MLRKTGVDKILVHFPTIFEVIILGDSSNVFALKQNNNNNKLNRF